MVAIITLIIVLLITSWYLIVVSDRLRTGLAPAISSPDSALKTICSKLKVRPGAEIWELGCGDARVISFCAQRHPKAKFIGIENGILMLFRAKWRTRRQPNVEIRYGNIKNTNPKTATNMYLYLLPEALDVIKNKFPKNCRVVSLEFRIPNKKPLKTALLSKPEKFAHRLYIYQF